MNLSVKPLSQSDRELREKFLIGTPTPGLMDWIDPRAWTLGRWIDLLLLEKRTWQPLAWRQRLRAWGGGYTSLSWVTCELDDKDLTKYLSDRAIVLGARRPNGRYYDAVYGKVNLAATLEQFGVPQPAVLGHLVRGKLYRRNDNRCDAIEKLFALLAAGERLVLRPSFGGGASGIVFLQQQEQQQEQSNDAFLINNITAQRDELLNILAPLDDYKHIFPDTTNTLRMLTLWDYAKDEPFIAATAHRFGRLGSGMVDNFHWATGGLSAPIELKTGRLGKGVMHWEGKYQRLSHHPESGAAIDGVVIPDWQVVVDELLELAASMPYATCVGWDLVKTNDGWVCLEGNPAPGYQVWQVHTPVMQDPRARRFYQQHGMAP